MVIQPAGTPNFRVRPAFGGNAPGASISAGFYFTRAVAVEGELVVAKTISAPQRFSYFWSEDYVSERRDVLIGANVRYNPGDMRWFEAFAGGGLAISQFANRSIIRTDYPVKTTAEPDQVETAHRPAFGAGIALNVPVGRRVTILPTASLRWIWRQPDYGLGAYMGASWRVYHIGLAVRFQ